MKFSTGTRRRQQSRKDIAGLRSAKKAASFPPCLRGELFLFACTLLQPVRLLELLRQLPCPKILPDMCQSLLHFEQSILEILLVADRNVTPHGIWTRSNSRHLPQCLAAGGKQRRLFSKLLHQSRGQRR